jgi:hypothetical protein
MPGIILSLKMGPTRIVTGPYLNILDGHRAILAVTGILAKVQTTVLFGNDLFVVGWTSNLDEPTCFKNFLMTYANRSEEWAQLSQIPPPPTAFSAARMLMMGVNPIPPPPVAKGKITLLNAGYEPVQGYWIEFLGNYFLHFPLFKDWLNVIRDGPDYKGFRPSENNPGTPKSGC